MPGPDYYEWQKLKREHSSVSFTGFASLEKETRSEMFRRVLVVFLLVSALDVGSSVKTDSGGEPRGRGTTPFFSVTARAKRPALGATGRLGDRLFTQNSQ